MSFSYIILLIASVILLLVATIIFLYGSKSPFAARQINKNFFKYIPFSIIVGFLSLALVFYYNYNHSKQVEEERNEYKELLAKIVVAEVILNESKTKTIDSLNIYKQSLIELNNRVKKQVFIGGDKNAYLSGSDIIIERIDDEIVKLSKYNDVVNKADLDRINQYSLGQIPSDVKINCPTDTTKQFIKIEFVIPPNIPVDSISIILLQVVKNDGESYYINYKQGYVPRKGVNIIGVENFLLQENVQIEIGYILKSELKKEYPNFMRFICPSLRKK